MGKGREGGGGMVGGALLILGEPKSPLEEFKLFLGELESTDERLTILLTMEGFFSEKKREMYECKRNEEIKKIFPLLITI